MFTAATRQAHAAHEGATAVLDLLKRLRSALSEGQPTVDVPTVLGGAAPARQPSALLRAEVARRLDQLVATNDVDADDAGVLRERFALDGKLRTAREIGLARGIGREAMRMRYHAAATRLADRLAEMPLVLRPEVAVTRAELELRVAFGLESHRPTTWAEREYTDARVRHRLLGHAAPPAPGRGRAEDRRWQRMADRIGGAVETALSDEEPVPPLPPLSDETLAAIRNWLDLGGEPTEEVFAKDFAFALYFLRAIANGQAAQLEPELTRTLERSDEFEGEPEGHIVSRALENRGLLTRATFVAAVRASDVSDPVVRVVGKLIEQHLADDLARAGYVDAAEHVMRLAADSSDVARKGWHPSRAHELVTSFAMDRFITRGALHFARGPHALEDLRATLQAAATFSARRPGGIEYPHACRLKLLAVSGEIAAYVAGTPVEAGFEHYRTFTQTLAHSPAEPLSPGIDAMMRDYPKLLEDIWTGHVALSLQELEQSLVEGVASWGPGTRLLVQSWTRPR
jgi:hypothetical protein